MSENKIKVHEFDNGVENVHHISVGYNGSNYCVIFGEYINGGFFSIPNWGVGGELAQLDDTLWNTGSLRKVLKDTGAARAIAFAIAKISSSEDTSD